MYTGQGPWGPDPWPRPLGRGNIKMARGKCPVAVTDGIGRVVGSANHSLGRVVHASCQNLTRTRFGRVRAPLESPLGRENWLVGRCCQISAALQRWPTKSPAGI